MAKTQRRSVGRTAKPTLLFFPPSVLRCIFLEDGTITYDNFLLCKTLLPHTLQALYVNVQLTSRTQLAQFAAAVRRRPVFLDRIREFGISDSDRCPVDGHHEWDTEANDAGSGQMLPSGGQGVPYDPDSIIVGLGLVKDIVTSIARLYHLLLCGKPFLSILSARFLSKNPFPHLLGIETGQDYDEDFEEDDTLFHRLTLLPPLVVCTMSLPQNKEAPLPLLNLVHTRALQPRSWHVEQLNIEDGGWAAPEFRHVFAALSDICWKVSLSFSTISPSFPFDVSFLPSSLTQLVLQLGRFCTPEETQPTQVLPNLSDSLSQLINLEHLHLLGNMLTPASFRVITGLPRLGCLLLGAHTSYSLSSLLPLFQRKLSSNPPLRALECLTIHLCRHCVIFHRQPKKKQVEQPSEWDPEMVRWLAAFPKQDALKLIMRDGQNGTTVEGTLRCALRLCIPTSRHAKVCEFF